MMGVPFGNSLQCHKKCPVCYLALADAAVPKKATQELDMNEVVSGIAVGMTMRAKAFRCSVASEAQKPTIIRIFRNYSANDVIEQFRTICLRKIQGVAKMLVFCHP